MGWSVAWTRGEGRCAGSGGDLGYGARLCPGGRCPANDQWIYPAVRPDGKRIRMLKVLQSNVCENNCAYCAFRRDRDVRRTAFQPDELAGLFADLARSGRVEGLFLSSGVCGNAVAATERMLATADLVRHRYQFGGYLHLKILPGTDLASIEEFRDWLRESPLPEASNCRVGVVPDKRYETVYISVADVRRNLRAVSLTTQFVVGAAGEWMRSCCKRAPPSTATSVWPEYYGAFQPVSAHC